MSDHDTMRKVLTILYDALDEGAKHHEVMSSGCFALVVLMLSEGIPLELVLKMVKLQHRSASQLLSHSNPEKVRWYYPPSGPEVDN